MLLGATSPVQTEVTDRKASFSGEEALSELPVSPDTLNIGKHLRKMGAVV